ncbi:MAG: hypothetical protein GXP08_11910 [Gammaproteobacteria bacterium]|nr:hypothetical protein [Gammaproteobacteria bacterium]
MNINLRIEKVVLDGVNITTDQRDSLQASVTTELARLFAEGGLSSNLAQGAAISRMSTGDIQLTGNNPMQFGQKIAQSVYGGMDHE